MTPNKLNIICTFVWGGVWEFHLARALNVNVEEVLEWKQGKKEIPVEVPQRLIEICNNEIDTLNRFVTELT